MLEEAIKAKKSTLAEYSNERYIAKTDHSEL